MADCANPICDLPTEAEVLERIQETPGIFSLRLRFTEPALQQAFQFMPGQFNMLYLHGVGEVPISIVSDPSDEHLFEHTIRRVGRVTQGLDRLQAGDRVGVRGPFGRGWPLAQAEGKDVVIMTGGLGCAPVVSVIHYILRRRERFRRLVIIQGVKHADDLIWRDSFERWSGLPDTQVLLAADHAERGWPWHLGLITELIGEAHYDAGNAVAMLCGPEGMMRASAETLQQRGIPPQAIWLSMERNMQCGGRGLCGHCQLGSLYVCRDGPVFNYAEIYPLLEVEGV